MDINAGGIPTLFDLIQATSDHLDTLVPLFDAYRQFYEQTSDVIGARTYLSERLKNQEATVFLALDPGGVGLGFTLLYPSFSSVSMRRIWVLNDLFVTPDARKQGVGEALLNRARQHAAETDARSLMLQTAIDNIPAQSLYEKLGWVRDEDFYVYTLRVE
ncbi:MAG: GNAT family N-acetyltransferase [Chloroflexi bacterium]|nr:MAG: GNAT family N-acetyltransferase [Chloroflexota bacterium]